jgi:hypothetical protein
MIGMIILLIIIFLLMVLTVAGAWLSNSDPMTDYDLYGMDAEEYLKEQAGEEFYNEHLKD